MNNKLLIGLIVVCSLVGGAVSGAVVNFAKPLVGGDFAGGNQPTNLVTGSAGGGATGNGYVQPVGSLELVGPNGIGIGSTDIFHAFTAYVSASGTLPSGGLTLGALGLTTSTATTTVTVPEVQGLSVGAICSGGIATTSAYIAGCLLSSINGATGTATVAVSNVTGASVTEVSSTRVSISFEQLPY
jgi:hypothetical protein